jgi:Ca2+-binding RTX toxin-like protein
VTVDVAFSLSSLQASDAAENDFSTVQVSYQIFVNALRQHATTAADALAVNGLPAADPSGGAGFEVPLGEADVLGLVGAQAGVEDSVTLNSRIPWTFGQDAVGAIEHEITEGVFGRIGSLGVADPQWAPMDLFRFTAAGQRDDTGGSDGVTTYFGLDGSHVSALVFHNSVNAAGVFDGFDLADWDNTTADAFGGGGAGVATFMSPTDLQILDILGWSPVGAPSVTTGTAGNDALTASAGDATLEGLGGADTLAGGAGSDVLFGGAGADLISTGTGFNRVNGNAGDDTIVGHSQVGDWLLGGQGNDLIDATQSSGHNIVNGNLGDDVIHGGSGGDTLRGGQGDDAIVGGAGPDLIFGDLGHNTLTGGGGANTFVAGAGVDTITDFNPAQGDRIEIAPALQFSATQSGSDVQIHLGDGGEMILQNVQLTSLGPTAGWVLLA